ncbi:MAG: AmmeMemoRadiSam system radical SAM enzyme [Actinobacteria bacterium]|nr:AmmeMemoRadiSam system radical SAM enzyme [Actinomycetota bacterium]
MREAYLYTKLKNLKVRCDLCNHRCMIKEGERGKCCVRENIKGKLYSLVYRKLISENIDPIEKKPLFHFHPGSYSLSIATVGCNFKCFFCQNHQISQMPCESGKIEGRDISPEDIVEYALKYKCKSISYTYTEPTIYFEYAYDIAKLASSHNIKNIFVTNGFMTKECLGMIEPFLDAANIDLKSFSNKTYVEKIGGRLRPVLDNIIAMKEAGIWIEVTTLIIPGINSSRKELKGIADFLADVDKTIPWHISAYSPQYKSDLPATGVGIIKDATEIGKKAGLKYVYGGNIGNGRYENTICNGCDETIIERIGFTVVNNHLEKGKCSHCGEAVDGVFW